MMSFAAAFLTDFHHVPVTSPTGPILHRGHYTGTDWDKEKTKDPCRLEWCFCETRDKLVSEYEFWLNYLWENCSRTFAATIWRGEGTKTTITLVWQITGFTTIIIIIALMMRRRQAGRGSICERWSQKRWTESVEMMMRKKRKQNQLRGYERRMTKRRVQQRAQGTGGRGWGWGVRGFTGGRRDDWGQRRGRRIRRRLGSRRGAASRGEEMGHETTVMSPLLRLCTP